MKLLFAPKVRKTLLKLEKPILLRIKKKLIQLGDEKVRGERLEKPLRRYYKLRVGVYRILYEVKPDCFYIVKVEHRSRVYKR